MEEIIVTAEGQLSATVLQHSEWPRNYGPLSPFNAHAWFTGPCGDTMEFWLWIEDDRVAEIGFTTDGCGPSRAAGSMASELALGKRPAEVARIEQADVLAVLGGLPKDSEHCALLACNTLKAAAQDFGGRKADQPRDCQSCEQANCPAHKQRQDESEEEFRRRQHLDHKMCQIGHKLLILSGKGGVGKSTVAANLAVSLTLAGKSVGLLDVDIHGPSIPQLMGLEGQRPTMHESEIAPLDIGGNLKVMSIGFLLGGPEDAVIWRGPLKFGVIRQFLGEVDWGPLDYLVIDSPPGTGDEPLSVAQLVGEGAGAVLVTTPQELSVADVRRSVSFCRKLSLPVVGIIENMSGLVCPHCGGRIEVFKSGGGEALAREMNVPLLGRIPIDPRIVECGDLGVPYIHRFADSDAATAFAGVVERILGSTSTKAEGN